MCAVSLLPEVMHRCVGIMSRRRGCDDEDRNGSKAPHNPDRTAQHTVHVAVQLNQDS